MIFLKLIFCQLQSVFAEHCVSMLNITSLIVLYMILTVRQWLIIFAGYPKILLLMWVSWQMAVLTCPKWKHICTLRIKSSSSLSVHEGFLFRNFKVQITCTCRHTRSSLYYYITVPHYVYHTCIFNLYFLLLYTKCTTCMLYVYLFFWILYKGEDFISWQNLCLIPFVPLRANKIIIN